MKNLTIAELLLVAGGETTPTEQLKDDTKDAGEAVKDVGNDLLGKIGDGAEKISDKIDHTVNKHHS